MATQLGKPLAHSRTARDRVEPKLPPMKVWRSSYIAMLWLDLHTMLLGCTLCGAWNDLACMWRNETWWKTRKSKHWFVNFSCKLTSWHVFWLLERSHLIYCFFKTLFSFLSLFDDLSHAVLLRCSPLSFRLSCFTWWLHFSPTWQHCSMTWIFSLGCSPETNNLLWHWFISC